MVERKEKTDFEQIEAFDGILESVELEAGTYEEKETRTIHMVFEALDKEAKAMLEGSKTGKLHNFIRLSETAELDIVPEDSTLDKYLTEVETVFPEAKDAKTIIEALELMKGVKARYVWKKLGKSYRGHPGRSYFVPQKTL